MTKESFVKRLKQLRAEMGLTQATISQKIGISQRLYEYYESEKHSSFPSVKNLIILANFFNCSIDFLLCQSHIPKRC